MNFQKIFDFANKISKGYHNLNFHNEKHILDTIITLNCLLKNYVFINKMDDLEIYIIFCAALCHDY